MKNIVSKVLMMFVMSFTLLVSCSYAAEFNAIPNPAACTSSTYSAIDDPEVHQAFKDTLKSDTGYTVSQIFTIGSYKTSDDPELLSAYTTAMNILSAKGYLFFSYTDVYNKNHYYIIKTSKSVDVGYFVGSERCIALLLNEGDIIFYRGSVDSVFNINSSGLFTKKPYVPTFHNSKVKNLSNDFHYIWTTSQGYYFEPTLCNAVGDVAPIPDTPSGNHDLAGLISAITSSDVVKDNVPYANKEYFIIPYGEVNGVSAYEVYFYTSQAYLSAFEWLGSDSRLYYDLDKISVDGVLAKVFDFFNLLTGHYITIYHYSENDNYEIIYNGEFSFDSDLLVGLDSEKNPIIYTSKDITYYYYEKDETTGEWIATSDISKDKNNETVFDKDGNEVSPFVNYLDESIGSTPWNKFVNIIISIPKKIASTFSEMLGYTKISYMISPLLTGIGKILSVLLASISFIGRAITFVYTLPTIEASSAMFAADVATNTKGLVFTGNNWGHHFLSGLTRLKALSWNGINLWSFFEAFVLALLVILVIKLVRKHYHV